MNDRRRVPPLLMREIEARCLGWRIENGTRHLLLYVEEVFIGILPKSPRQDADQRNVLNMRSRVRHISK